MDGIRRLVRRIRKNLRRHGLRNTAYAGLLKAVRHHRWLKVLRGHYAEDVHPAFMPFPQGYLGGFYTPRALAEFARDSHAGLAEEFMHYALGKGDKCYGFTCNGELRAYGWYATTPTRVSPELTLHFKRDYIYMYKGYTQEQHRGKRLFPIGMTRALRHYRSAGYKGMLLYVEASNLSSLKSCARMGFRSFGSVFVAKIFGRYFVYASPGCARFGFRVSYRSASPSSTAIAPASASQPEV
jgi:hypothetical protein